MSERKDPWLNTLKKDKQQLGECKHSQNGQRKKKVRESSNGAGEVEEKG